MEKLNQTTECLLYSICQSMAGCPSHQQADRDRPVQHARLQPGLAPGGPPLVRRERGQEEAPQLKHGEYFTGKKSL